MKSTILYVIIGGLFTLHFRGLSSKPCTSYEWIKVKRFTGTTIANVDTVNNITDGSVKFVTTCTMRCLLETECNVFQYHSQASICLLANVNNRSRMHRPYNWFPTEPIFQVGDVCRNVNGEFISVQV